MPARGSERFLRELFTPLGYEIELQRELLDPKFESWGFGPYYRVTLRATKRLSELLSHLYVLVPVLDDEKHYYVGDDEVDKLIDKAGDWLDKHPLREQIASRYLKRLHRLTREALGSWPSTWARRLAHGHERAVFRIDAVAELPASVG